MMNKNRLTAYFIIISIIILITAINLNAQWSPYMGFNFYGNPYGYGLSEPFNYGWNQPIDYSVIRTPGQLPGYDSTLNTLQYWPDVNYYSQPGGSAFRFYSPTSLLSSFNSYIPIGNRYGKQLGYSQPFTYGIWNFNYPQYRFGDLADSSFVPITETTFWTDFINTDVQRTIQGFFGKVYSWPQGELLYGPPYM